jgi:hypothetical protein
MEQRKKVAGFGAAVAIAVGLAWWFGGGGTPEEPDPKHAAAAGAPAEGSQAGREAVDPTAGGSAPAVPTSGPYAQLNSEQRLRQVLADYKKAAEFPPWSRPHDEGTAYKLKWNEPVVMDLPLSDAPDDETFYRFNADKAHVMPGEALITTVEVMKVKDPSVRVPTKFKSAVLASVSGSSPGRIVDLEYRDDGKDGDEVAGDLKYTNRFVPSDAPELRKSQEVRLIVIAEAGGVQTRMLRDFTYSPRKVIEIGDMSDGLVDGHLVVTIDTVVLEKGVYTFEANVYSGEMAVAYVDQSFTLEPGPQKVTLRVFGRAMRMARRDGPYVVRDLRGMLRGIGTGEHNVWWSDPRSHLTSAYRVGDFSEGEWDSPEKREKIARLEQLAQKAANGTQEAPGGHIFIGPDGVAKVVK